MIEDIFNKISTWSVFLPFFLGLAFIKLLNSRAMIIWILTGLATLPQMAHRFLPDGKEIFYNAYTIAEFSLTLCFFYTFFTGKIERVVIYSCLVVFAIVYLSMVKNYGIGERFLSEMVCFDNMVYTGFSLYILYKLFDEEQPVINLSSPEFYFLLGILFFAPITVFVFSIWDYIHNSHSAFATTARFIKHISNTILYLLFSVAFLKCYYNRHKVIQNDL